LKQDVVYLYGSARVGEYLLNRDSATAWNRHYYRVKGNRHYELTNHLGNVLAVVTDRKMAKDTTTDATYTPQFFMPDVYSVQNYYAFGQSMPGWSGTAAVNDPKKYRFGYNGKEDDDEWGKQDYGFRISDPRIGRFLSVDPLMKEYPELTTYQFASNTPIIAVDLDGLEAVIYRYRFNADAQGATLIESVDNVELVKAGNTTVMINKTTGALMTKDELGKVQYQYYNLGGDRLPVRRDLDGGFERGENELLDKHNSNFFGSVYIGNKNPMVGKEPDYRREPQDAVDKAAMEHDMDYDYVDAKGFKGAMSSKTIEADKKLISRCDQVMLKYFLGLDDEVTGKPITSETFGRALSVAAAFRDIVAIKEALKAKGKEVSPVDEGQIRQDNTRVDVKTIPRQDD
jgi:RHS repeat-associated protein